LSRTIPRAYITAAWNRNPVVAKEEARKYCQELVKEGYLPLCPLLAFDGIFSAEDQEAHRKYRDMSEDLLRRARFLVICGDKQSEDVKDDISIARKAKVIVTTLEGVIGFV
jgi:dienelactone hydrolase